MWLYLDRLSDLWARPRRLLHFAPEPAIEAKLAGAPNLTYTTCDIEPGRAQLTIDAQQIDLPDASVDVIICAHLLEHVPDDRLAMRELRRILTDDGWAILQVPIFAEHTDEDPTLTDPAERVRRFGQEDHVRVYGPDYYDRLREAGFDLERVDLRRSIDAADLDRFGVHFKVPGLEDTAELFEIPVSRPLS
jgi:SAM-dependent methyltransferase